MMFLINKEDLMKVRAISEQKKKKNLTENEKKKHF